MTQEFAEEKRLEYLSLLRKGKKVLSELKSEKVVSFDRYRRNVVAMKRIATKLASLPKP